jgi:hypothetical protein
MKTRAHHTSLFAFALLSWSIAHGSDANAQAVSGESSGDLVVAVDRKTGILTGYYHSGTGYDESTGESMFSCIFYIRGRAVGKSPYRIDTWFPDRSKADPVIAGRIAFSRSGAQHKVTITLDEEHGGCWNVQRFADPGGASFELDRMGSWTAVRVVSAPRAYFHAKAQANTRRKAYVTTGDMIRVSPQVAGWVHADYVGDEGPITSGWIREADLFPAEPSPR